MSSGDMVLDFLNWLDKNGHKEQLDNLKKISRSLSQTRRLISIIPELDKLWKEYIKEMK